MFLFLTLLYGSALKQSSKGFFCQIVLAPTLTSFSQWIKVNKSWLRQHGYSYDKNKHGFSIYQNVVILSWRWLPAKILLKVVLIADLQSHAKFLSLPKFTFYNAHIQQKNSFNNQGSFQLYSKIHLSFSNHRKTWYAASCGLGDLW